MNCSRAEEYARRTGAFGLLLPPMAASCSPRTACRDSGSAAVPAAAAVLPSDMSWNWFVYDPT
jgi:hypothetical protein